MTDIKKHEFRMEDYECASAFMKFLHLRIVNPLIAFLSCFILSKKIRRNFRKKYTHIKALYDNAFLIVNKDGTKKRIYHTLDNLGLMFRGKGSVIEIPYNAQFCNYSSLSLCANNHYFKVGKNFYVRSANFILEEDNSSIIIGDNCMFSDGIYFWNSDFHSIFEVGKQEAYNFSRPIIIGNHVWLGFETRVVKGAVIPDNTVVGMSSLVTGKFTETNTILAGNPIKVVKRNINWSMEAPHRRNAKLEKIQKIRSFITKS